MAFRDIGTLAGEVMKRVTVEPGTERSTVKCAHPSGPHNTGEEGGRVAMRMGKWADAETPARVGQEVSQTKDKSRGGTAMSYRKPTLTVLPVSKRMKVARPTGVAPRHAAFIRLVTVNGHAVTHPQATAR